MMRRRDSVHRNHVAPPPSIGSPTFVKPTANNLVNPRAQHFVNPTAQHFVIPAKAGIHLHFRRSQNGSPPSRGRRTWVPAFAGTTNARVTLALLVIPRKRESSNPRSSFPRKWESSVVGLRIVTDRDRDKTIRG